MRHSSPDQASRLTVASLRGIFRILSVPSYQIFPDWIVFSLIPVIVVAYLIAGYFIILAPGNLYNAVVSEDWDLFRSEISVYALIASAAIITKVLRGALRETATNCLRIRLTHALHQTYLTSPSPSPSHPISRAPLYYNVVTEPTLDNPDQRIVADAREFSFSLFGILAGVEADSGGLLEGVISVFLYTKKTLMRTGWYGVGVAYFWSFLVSLLTIFVVNRTSPAVFRQEKLEADFRFAHVELRRRAEEVAFLNGSHFEHVKLTETFGKAVSNMWVVIRRHICLNFVQYGFSYYISVVMYLAIALAIHRDVFESAATTFSSDMTPGEKARWVSQTGGIFIQLLYSFTMMIQLGTSISKLVSNSQRLVGLLDAFDVLAPDTPTRGAARGSNSDLMPLIACEDGFEESSIDCTVGEGINVHHLLIKPHGDRIIGPISFAVAKGYWLLIEGPTGSGKTSILRVLKGLWKPSSGSVRIPYDEKTILFMPQNPYLPAGLHSLRQLVRYPHSCSMSRSETDQIVSAFNALGWLRTHARETLDALQDWSERLSPGEVQLIAAARILLAKPDFVVLDEPTASLDTDSEKRIFLALKQAGISGVTVGHSRSLRSFHDEVISLGGG